MKIRDKSVTVRRRGQRGISGRILTYAGLASYGLYLAFRIPLSNILGDIGIGLLAPALEIFFLITVFFSYGLTRIMTGLIRYRIKRKQYKSARWIFKVSFRLALFSGILMSAVIALFSGFIADILVLETLSRRAILVTALTIIPVALISVYRGYFNGSGLGMLTAHSQYIEKISMVAFAMICGELFYNYGLKAAALLQNEMVSYAYGTMGVTIGIMLSELLTLLHLLFFYGIYSGVRKRQLLEDMDRRLENKSQIMGMLLHGGLPVAIITLLCNAYLLIDQRFFNYCMNRMGPEADRTYLWGSYYGKTAVLIGIASVMVCLAIQEYINRIVAAYEKEEYRIMRDRIGSTIKKMCIVSFPIAAYTAVLAEALVCGLYKGETKQAVLLLRVGAAAIVLYGIAFLFGQLLLRFHYLRDLFIAVLAAFLLHLGVVYLLMQQLTIGALGVLYGMYVFAVVFAIIAVFFVVRRLSYRQEWLRSIVFPAFCTGLSGLVVVLLNKLLLSAAGEIITVLVSCFAGVFFYILLLIVFRVLQEGELSKLPFGTLWITLGRMIGAL